MNKKQQLEKEFRENFKCIQGDCDGNGYIQISEEDIQQCQFHAEYILKIEQFIDTKITEILDEAMLKKQDKSFKRTEQEPTDDEKAYIDGYNKAIKEISEKIKSLGF